MELGLAGRVALVAGGSSGLGLAVAEELAREGAHVAIGARDEARLAQAERRLKTLAAVVKIGGAAGVDLENVCADVAELVQRGERVAVVNGGSEAGSSCCARCRWSGPR